MILSALAGLIAYAAVAIAVALGVPRLIAAGAPVTEWLGIATGLTIFLLGLLLQEIFQRRAQTADLRKRLTELASLTARLTADLRDFSVGRKPGTAPAQDLATLTAEMKIMKSLVAQLSGQAPPAGERPGARPALSALSKPFRDPTEPFIGPPGARPLERALATPALGAAKKAPPAAPIAPTERGPGEQGPVAPLDLDDDDRLIDVMRVALIDDRLDLYVEPIVQLPQRKLAHQHCVGFIRAGDGTVIPPQRYQMLAVQYGLWGAIDNLLLRRLVSLVRRLRRQRMQGLSFFCPISAVTLGSRDLFTDFYGFLDENRDLNQHVTFEISQYDFYHLDKRTAYELENLSKAGFRYALGEVTNLDLFVTDLSERGFRYVKVPGEVLLQELSRIHEPRALKRALDVGAIDLIATNVGTEERLLELVDFAIDFVEGPVFGPARPEELA